MLENVWYVACLAGLWVLGTRGAAAQVLPAGQACSAAFGPRHQLVDVLSLSETNPFGASTELQAGRISYPDGAAFFNLTQACCPRGSFISEWEATLKTFQVPSPFGDGRIRSLNGTILDDYVNSTQGPYKAYYGRFDYRTWNLEYLGRNTTWDISWDDIQGIALSTLQNYTILGSLAAKCSLGNGTVVAQLPVVGSNLTGDCFNPPGLEVTESEPIRIINSTSSAGSFENLFYDNQLKLPINVTSSGRYNRNSALLRQYGYQQSPYQDFMGLMRILEITAENAPEVVDVATLDLSRIAVDSFTYTSIRSDKAEKAAEVGDWVAMNGFSAIAGCYGPVEIQVFAEPKLLDVAPLPDATSYKGCSRGEREVYDNKAYEGAGFFLAPLDLDTTNFRNTDRFSKSPVVCCPDGEYITSFDLEFSGDPSYSSQDSDGSYPKRLWGIAGVCSSGIRLPAISGGNGCSGRSGLLPASNYTFTVPYDNESGSGSQYTSIGFRSDDLGIISVAGITPNASADVSGKIIIGANEESGKTRIVGLEATASCDALSSLGFVLRPLNQIQPSGGGGLSGGAIAGIVIGVVAAVALLACTILLILNRRDRHRGSSIDTLPLNANR